MRKGHGFVREMKEKMRKRMMVFLMCLMILVSCLAGTGLAQEKGEAAWESRIADLNHARIGLVTGQLQSTLLPQMLPEATYTEYNMNADAAMALAMGKIDAFSVEDSVYQVMLRQGQNIKRIDEPLLVSEYGMLFGKDVDPQLIEDFNAFLAKCKEDGTLKKQEEKWFGLNDPADILSLDGMTGEKGKLLFAIEAAQRPFAFIMDGQFTGFDVELLILFAKAYGYQLEIADTSFAGLLTGIEQGKYDMGGSGVTITEERKETMTFSDPYHTEDIVVVVQGDGTIKRTLADFENATLGVIDGSLYDGFSRKLFPNAQIDSYPSFNDLFQCVKQKKIDGFLLDIPNLSAVQRTDKNLSYIPVPGYSVEIGIAFGKNETGEKLQKEMNAFLNKINSDGTYDALWTKWCGETEPMDPPAEPAWAADAEELNVVLDLSRKPFVYLLNNRYAGFEVELMYLFCEANGYKPNFESAQWTSGVAGLKEGKYDVVSCGIYMTEERKESVNFCDPYSIADVVMVIYNEGEASNSFWASLQSSFEKTFIREDRWKLIVEGIINTLILSVFSVVLGTMLGFGIYMLVRCKYRPVAAVVGAIAKVYARLIAGTPTLVVLMILYYIIFGKSDISGMTVGIIGFALTFGSFVYSHLALCVDAVDKGQTEAAYALGYNRNQTFFKIILPQSMKAFLPTYTGEVIGLIKATSVVGYISVSDLTKMGDIIRSNTYEAFFPLIAVAVIYFIITWGAAALLGLVQKKLDTHKRKRKNILKGVVK